MDKIAIGIETLARDSMKAIVQAGLDIEGNLQALEQAATTESSGLWIMNRAHDALAQTMKIYEEICAQYCERFPEGVWLLSIPAIPPLYSAGLVCGLVGLTLRRLSYVYRLCGLDPGAKEFSPKDAREFWVAHVTAPNEATLEEVRAIAVKTGRALEPGWRDQEEQGRKISKSEVFHWLLKRPHSEFLRTLTLRIRRCLAETEGEYFELYRNLREAENQRNLAGDFKADASKALQASKDRRWEDYSYYAKGILPPSHIDERAKRAMVKQFLADLYDRIDPIYKDDRGA